MNPRFAVLSALFSLIGIWITKQLSITGMAAIGILVIVLFIQLEWKSFYILLFLPFFFLYTNLYETLNTTLISPSMSSFHGAVTTIPEIDGKWLSFQFNTYDETVLVRYKIQSEDQKKRLNRLKINMNCSLKGTIEEPDQMMRFYGMDYKEYLRNKKIFWILEPYRLTLGDCKEPKEIGWAGKIRKWRHYSIRLIESRFSSTAAGQMNALLFGYREGISRDVLDAYQKLGLTHLLAVSGFNVGIVTYFFYVLFVRIGFVKEAAYGIIIAFLPVYILLTGGESSIVRAGIMGMLVLLVVWMGKRIDPAVLLAAVCIVMLLYKPGYAFELGFQLSFLMTFVLISSVSLFQNQSFFQLLLITSFMCSLFSFPIIIYHFFEFSFWSIPFNLLYIPLVSAVLFPVSFFAYVFILIFPSPVPMAEFFINGLFHASVYILKKAQSLPGTLILGRPAAFVLLLYLIALLFLFYKWEKRGGFHINHLIPFLSVITLQVLLPYLNPAATISFINVGQGDSILIELPYRRGVYLVDTGGVMHFKREEWETPESDYDVTEEVVHPFLKGRGIRKLDALLLTHRDMDHAGGAVYLLNEVEVDNLYMPAVRDENNLEINIKEMAEQKDVHLQYAKKGMTWGNREAQFLILHPEQKRKFSNNESIVLFARILGSTFLFTGDIEEEAEEVIMGNYQHLQSDVLKVAHHGSQTSTTESFLENTSPRYAVISVGKNNLYGHPDSNVIKRLKQRKIKIFRTDQNGDVIFRVTKRGLKAMPVH
jgi:competence protein ComEC